MINLVIKITNLPEGTHQWSVGSISAARATPSNPGGYIFPVEGAWMPPETLTVHLELPDNSGLLGFAAQDINHANLNNFNIMEIPESGTYVADFVTQTLTLEKEILPKITSWLPWAGLGLGILVLTKVFKKRS